MIRKMLKTKLIKKTGFLVAAVIFLFFGPIATLGHAQYYYNYYNPYGSPYTDKITITTIKATNITSGSATLNGLVNGKKFFNTANLNAWVEYGTSANLGYSTPRFYSNSGYIDFSSDIGSLSENTIYYFRAVAQGPQGISYGLISAFKTDLIDIVNADNSVGNSVSSSVNSPAPAPTAKTKTVTTVSKTENQKPNANIVGPLPASVLGWLVLLILTLVLILVIKHLYHKFKKEKHG